MKRKRLTFLFFSFTGYSFRVPRHRRIRRTAIWLLAIFLPGVRTAEAQFAGGFFNQQSTKEKLMAEQILGLDTYLGEIKTGYQITESGLHAAQDLKGGTFSLHTAYFNSLQQVSPAVQRNPKGKAIAELYRQLCSQFSAELSWQQQKKQLSQPEMQYLQKISANVQKMAGEDLSATADVLTPGKLQLTDQQRLDRLDKLYASMKDKAAFTASFTVKCRQLALARQRAAADRTQLKQLYGIQ
ncbi:hypothetical protein [Mucilaginibacter ginsenosidivorans]|uniref:TerB family tellurite resistance protein n=1 Tax=Mucilaginibacter ginsenosidivorans TaxID=398053 RepID=A0A5B8UU94_9SPHI|nr:hypothetical protein [Mucilaginibacter ginsenosidivorans]QEC62469.1 hypothetical protein FRZ54_07670 [Mucilaginibacter ginsenosidivorans]